MKVFISITAIFFCFSIVFGQHESKALSYAREIKKDSLQSQNHAIHQSEENEIEKEHSDKKDDETVDESVDKKIDTEVQVSTTVEKLSNNLGTWKSFTFSVRHDFSRRKVIYGIYQKTYRANLGSDSATVGFYQPLSKKQTLLLEFSASPSNNFVPKWSGLVQLDSKLSPTLILNTGFRHSVFKEAKVSLVNLGIEKYWKKYRLNYSAYVANLAGSGNSLSHRFRVDRYYGKNESTVSGEVLVGNEIQSVLTNAVVKSATSGVNFGGKHWFNSKFGLNYRASFYRLKNFYDKGGVTFGFSYRF